MMPGGPVADAVFADLVPRSEKLIDNGHTPGLGTILVGDDGASARYVGMKMEKARELGWSAPHQHLAEDANQADVLANINSKGQVRPAVVTAAKAPAPAARPVTAPAKP